MYDDQRNRGSQNNEIYVNGRPVNSAQQHYYEYDEGFVNDVMIRSFMFMFMAVLVTAIVALYTAQSGLYRVIFSSGFMLIAIVIAEFACVIFAGKVVASNNAPASTVLLFTYSILNGLLFSSIFLAYNMQSIVTVFFVTSAMFGVTAAVGALTKKNLASWGNYLFMGLIGIILASLVNMFLKSSSLDFAISIIGVLLFVGLTAFDTQKIKAIATDLNGSYSMNVLGMWGALELYMDFINLFLYLLRIFGRRD